MNLTPLVAGLGALTVMMVVASPRADALPAYSRIYQQSYQYRPSCAACHENGGGSAVTPFGRDFLRAGANAQAFVRVEPKDSDGDGATNGDEVRARTNPGDARSKPGTPGDWLGDAAQAPVPKEFLKKIIPSADAFAALEGTLNAAQVARVRAAVGTELSDEDKLPTFYFGLNGGKKTAVVQYVGAPTAAGPISIAVAMDISGTVTSVKVLKNPGAKAIEASGFLAQFTGKRLGDALEAGKDINAATGATAESAAVALAVKKAVAIISAVFSAG